jgi:aminomethyltransferase
MLKTTPLHPRTASLNQGSAWRRWAGYIVSSAYELLHDREYAAVRSTAGLFDVSPLYKYLVRGPDAARLLDRVVTRDVTRCRVHQVLYTPWCDRAGKQLDDGTVSRLDEQTFRLTAADPNLHWLHLNAVGMDATIEDVTDRVAALALQGPASREILARIAEADLESLRFFHLTPAVIRGARVTISRTGYTGDLGYEVWIDHADALTVWDALLEAGGPYGLVPAGNLALDLARVEAGLILLDVDYVSARRALIEDQKSSPFELDLAWTVKLEKATFVGRGALVAERERGPVWSFVGLQVDWDSLEALYAAVHLPPRLPTVTWRTSVPLYAGGRQVGYATSGCWSPLLKRFLALGHVEARYAALGTRLEIEITVEHRRQRALAEVVKKPFFDPPRKKA